jgi:tRNA/rRNA methyltransferase
MYTIVFVEPESSGNIGALARVMKNFSIKKLILVNPKCNINEETKARAKHAFDIVEKARVVKRLDGVINEFDVVVGTTGKTAAHYHEVRTSITPAELGKKVRTVKGTTIPANPRYPILNISHAAAIIFYELFAGDAGSATATASRKEKDILFRYIDDTLDRLELIRDKKKVKKTFRNVLNKSMMTPSEARALAGALREIKKKIR